WSRASPRTQAGVSTYLGSPAVRNTRALNVARNSSVQGTRVSRGSDCRGREREHAATGACATALSRPDFDGVLWSGPVSALSDSRLDQLSRYWSGRGGARRLRPARRLLTR